MHGMKRFSLVLVCVLYMSGTLEAHTLLVGVKGWGASSNSIVGQLVEEDIANATPLSTAETDKGTGFLIGPVIGFQPDNSPWSFSTALMLFGRFTQKIDMYIPELIPPIDETADQELSRLDLDFAVSRAFGPYFKLYGGYKYQYFDSKVSSGLFILNTKIRVHIPTIGAGVAYPLGRKLFTSAQAGIIYAISDSDEDTKPTFGFNVEGGISYLLSDSLIMQAGFRYQLYSIRFADSSTYEKESYQDTFSGFTLALVYMFRNFSIQPASFTDEL